MPPEKDTEEYSGGITGISTTKTKTKTSVSASDVISNFEAQPYVVKSIVNRILEDLGNQILGLEKFLQAIQETKYAIAAEELRQTKYYAQTNGKDAYVEEMAKTLEQIQDAQLILKAYGVDVSKTSPETLRRVSALAAKYKGIEGKLAGEKPDKLSNVVGLKNLAGDENKNIQFVSLEAGVGRIKKLMNQNSNASRNVQTLWHLNMLEEIKCLENTWLMGSFCHDLFFLHRSVENAQAQVENAQAREDEQFFEARGIARHLIKNQGAGSVFGLLAVYAQEEMEISLEIDATSPKLPHLPLWRQYLPASLLSANLCDAACP